MEGKKDPSGVIVVFPDELQAFIAKRREGTYLLLDVRQPEEYEDNHLPGSRLIPLPLLPGSLGELDRKTDTIVYCSSNPRSLSAARFLKIRGFESVFQLRDGIGAWEGGTVSGDPEFHLRFMKEGQSPIEAAQLAYRMENGMKQFYAEAGEVAQDQAVRDLLRTLGKLEANHIRRVGTLIESLGSVPEENGQTGGLMEGGIDPEGFLRRNAHRFRSPGSCLELAMALELQALDLYLRMARSCTDPAAGEVFNGLGDEEKNHLHDLGELLGRRAGKAAESADT
ncbi:MAG: hypothetical protein LLG06_05565 [Desulfobacteraceae bacterium]|nr:hypothetical protein [Desulfobacteraceae bacterium]